MYIAVLYHLSYRGSPYGLSVQTNVMMKKVDFNVSAEQQQYNNNSNIWNNNGNNNINSNNIWNNNNNNNNIYEKRCEC